MVTIKVISERGVEDKKIPQGFEDVQWCDYVEALCANALCVDDYTPVYSILTGIDAEDFELMSDHSQWFVVHACAFFWKSEPQYIEVPEHIKELSIAQGTWQQLIDCESEFKRVDELEKPQIAAAQMIIKTYADVDLKGMRVPEALGYWSFFFWSSLIGKSDGLECTMTKPITMRLQQVSKRFRRSGGSPRFTRLRKVTCLNTSRYWIKKPSTSTQPYYLKRLKGSTQMNCSTLTRRLTNL